MQSSVPGALAHCQSFLGGEALGFLAVARPFLEPLAGVFAGWARTPDCGAAGVGARENGSSQTDYRPTTHCQRSP